MLKGKRILLGIAGGIAVYRVAELTRMLKKSGAEVRCVMTRSACEFVTPLTFEALTAETVHTQLFDLTNEREMGHIQLARWADAVILAPATANLLARLTHGIADDLLSTLMQVCDKPILLAPAMNASMWESAANQRNITILKQRGMACVGPDDGKLACGEQGAGRLAELPAIMSALMPLVTEQSLQGQRWLINAGPTHEAWDGVRLLSNRASGKLGQLLAEQALMRGAEVIFIAGPGTPPCSSDVTRVDIESAEQMLIACQQHAAHTDVFIGSAAVSDYRFAHRQTEKLKRADTTTMHVQLEANPDIVAHIAGMHNRPGKVIAFAAESSNHIAYAKKKLQQKHVDAIVANDIGNMGSDHADGWWITNRAEHSIHCSTKADFATHIINHILELS